MSKRNQFMLELASQLLRAAAGLGFFFMAITWLRYSPVSEIGEIAVQLEFAVLIVLFIALWLSGSMLEYHAITARLSLQDNVP